MSATPVLRPFPWEEAIGFGLYVLKMPPDAFWRMTPRELALAIRAARGGSESLSRATFSELLKRFPDDRHH